MIRNEGWNQKKLVAALTILALAFVIHGCFRSNIIYKKDPEVGLNGSFEITADGYPVNWAIHALPLEAGTASVHLDKSVFVEGTQSLQIISTEVGEAEDVWGFPGCYTLIKLEPGMEYKISFWLQNDRTTFSVRYFIMKPGRHVTTRSGEILRSGESFAEWRYFEHIFIATESEGYLQLWFRMIGPGTLWIDDVRVEQNFLDSPIGINHEG